LGAAYFYHLTRRPLDETLRVLLERAGGAGWRVAVRGTERGRMEWLDERLWLGPEDSFLAHGLAGGAQDALQPVLLCTEEQQAGNDPACLMTLDGARLLAEEVQALERVCVLFDGHDESAVQVARGQWRALTKAGCAAQYWSEESGRWEKKAEA
jgi:DNA polymerase-3 subunit chi